jgi:plasmid replication initiation protein
VERTDPLGKPAGIELIVPDWFYSAVLSDALILTIDRAYFSLTGGFERWLYRIVRKHGGRQRGGWRFEFRHLYLKSGSLSPFKRFAFELRDVVRRQPLPGYRLWIEAEVGGHTLLGFQPLPCGQIVGGLVRSGTRPIVPSGTGGSCHKEPKLDLTRGQDIENRAPNLDSNTESNVSCARGSGEKLAAEVGAKSDGKLSGRDVIRSGDGR